MNKFITLALFALCATMAHGQVLYPGWNSALNQQNSGSASSADASASSSSSSNSANNGLVSSWGPAMGAPIIGASPIIGAGPFVGNAGWVGPVAQQGWVSPLAGAIAPQGWVSPVAAGPWVSQGLPVGVVGPCGQGIY